MKRYRPMRDDPQTMPELMAWICARLAIGERAVCSQWAIERTGVEEWTSGRPEGRGKDRDCKVWVCSEPLHRPEVAEAFERHYDRMDRSGAMR